MSAYAGSPARIAFSREPGMATAIKKWEKNSLPESTALIASAIFFDQCLRDHDEVDDKATYILMNPVRRGLYERAEDWVCVYRPNVSPKSVASGACGTGSDSVQVSLECALLHCALRSSR